MASQKTVSAPARAGRGGGAAMLALVPLLAAALALTACSSRTPVPARRDALRGRTLGPVVDSVVVRPFESGAGIRINAADLNLFRDQFEKQLLVRPRLRAYSSPPTMLANTVILSGKLLGYEVREQTADGMFLRTIATTVEVAVQVGAEQKPALVLRRNASYQKLYLHTEGVAALEYDLRNAAREATGSIARVLVPGEAETPVLQSAVDADTGEDYSHPWLVRGNREAGFGRYDRAIASWSLLVYQPTRPEKSDRFRVSERTLARLQDEGAPQEQLDALRPLAQQRGRSLESLRDELTEALGPDSGLEAKVLQFSDEAQDRIQVNLSRAHYNLGAVLLPFRRYDIAAYHLARAYAFDPRPVYLDAWTRLQIERGLIPASAQDDPAKALPWLKAYLRVPAPFTASVAGGAYDLTVMPPPVFQPDEPPARPAPAAPVLMPVALPPPVVMPPAPVSSARPAPQSAASARPRAGTQPAPARPLSQPAQRLGY